MDQARLIERSARFFANRTAVVYENKRLTFREVNERANRLANALAGLGVKKGEKVATLRRNCLEHVEITFSLIKGGFVEVALNPRLNASEISCQISDSAASVVIVQECYAELIESIRHELPVRHFICFDGKRSNMLNYEDLLSRASSREPRVELNLSDLAELRYTAGTTGKPKCAMLTLQSGLCAMRNLLIDAVPDLTPQDTFLALQPLYHGAGWFVLPCWVRGVTQVIMARYDPELVFDAIEKERVSVIKTVPTVLVRLLNSPEIRKPNLKSIRTIMYGTSPMPEERLKEAIRIFGSVFVQLYGQVEAAITISLLRKEEHIVEGSAEEVHRLASAGRPYTFVDVKIVNDEGEEVATGEKGEVILKGDQVMTGYLNREQETKATLRNGWLYTRDIGVRDEGGYIYLVGRKNDMMITGGLNVYPNEVERVLYMHPAVSEAAVIGIPDQEWGETIKACIVLRDGKHVTEDEIIGFCKEHLSSYKKPRSIDFMNELPKSTLGKILRRELRQKYL